MSIRRNRFIKTTDKIIIGIGKEQPLSVGMFQPNIACMAGSAPILVKNQLHILPLGTRKMGKIYFLRRAIIIHHNYLHVIPSGDAIQAALQQGRNFVVRNYDRKPMHVLQYDTNHPVYSGIPLDRNCCCLMLA